MTDTQFARRFSRKTGILELMDDLGRAMSGDTAMRMLGGGNPASIPEVNKVWREQINRILADGQEFEALLANYSTSRGRLDFLDSVAGLLNREFGWNLSGKNIAVTNSSQTAFFFLLNLFSGKAGGEAARLAGAAGAAGAAGTAGIPGAAAPGTAGAPASSGTRKILFPVCPEYIGYANQTIEENALVSRPAGIELTRENFFKYRVDFSTLDIAPDTGALCVSRPTNPTGNVITDDEMKELARLAEAHDIPFLVDNAYGAPFPNIIFRKVQPLWNRNIVLSMSLSKLGLPGVRTGIVVAREDIIEALAACSAVVSLATGNLGQVLVKPLMDSGEILALSRNIVLPFYQQRARLAVEAVREAFGSRFPYRIHESEGSLFLWLWFPELPVSSRVLYERLKKRGVLVVSGHYFFFGLEKDWEHSRQCLRLSYALDPAAFREAAEIMADEVCRIMDEQA